jgi:2-hydroxychromene-2-carboxylate isomerase
MVTTRADFWSGTTARARRFESPLREFLRTESGGAAVLLAATAAGLELRMADLVSYADRLGLDVARFTEDVRGHVGANRIGQDVEGADLSGVSGTPTFFINGRRHHGAYDIDHLSRAVRAAGARAKLAAS